MASSSSQLQGHGDTRQILIAAGLSSQVYLPEDGAYKARESSFWSANAAMGPKCIVQPRNTAEVSLIMKSLSETGEHFAVRSGGHGQWCGASNIENGVTVDLGLMEKVTYDPQTNLASIEPGPNWGEVYRALEVHGVCVAGGRDAGVGIGGFLTGGGNSYYTGHMGFGCDSVVNFEVVLADGKVVNANATSNSDLWKALKGGSGNFGVVTRFDMKAFPMKQVWGGISAMSRDKGEQVISAFVNFTNNNERNPETAYLIIFIYNPSRFADVSIASVSVDTQGNVDHPAFNEMRQIPTFVADLKLRSMAGISTDYILPAGDRNVWFTLTFKNDAAIIRKAAELNDQMIAELKTILPPTAFTIQCIFQPIPSYFAKLSLAAGGNVLGLDSVKGNSILWLGTAAVKTVEHEAIVREKLCALCEAIEAFAISVGGLVPWRYLNYADSTQNPLSTYGEENLAFLKTVARKYDPTAVFQRSPGAFKLSRV